jgi:hypothetical protein
MKKIYFLILLILAVSIIIQSCGQDPAVDQSVEISIATFNDNVIKYAININSGVIDTSTIKVIAGDLTGIKVPIDIEINRVNKLFVLSQGNGPVPPQVTIFSDTAHGNIRPEAVIDVNTGTNFKPIGLTLVEGTDFMFVSYFSLDGTSRPKIIRFSISSGARTPFEISSQSIGDIEMLPSGTTIFAVDPLGRQILRLFINSTFEIQPGFDTITGNNTGLQNPNSIALTTDGTIHVFDKLPGSDEGRIFIFDAGATGNTAPSGVLWNRCPGRTLLAPYGLAAAEYVGGKFILACSGNNLTTFPADTSGCIDFIQRIGVGAPVAVAFDKVRF